jgi:hypothetical protein
MRCWRRRLRYCSTDDGECAEGFAGYSLLVMNLQTDDVFKVLDWTMGRIFM